MNDISSERAEVVCVTPHIARTWLSRNEGNRVKKDSRIAAYARDMRAGHWRYTGEAIKFAKSGRLLDGQNRLHAIILANTPVPMLVVRGLDDDAQQVMDSGTARTSRDALKLDGFDNVNELSSAVTVHIQYLAGRFRTCNSFLSGTERPSHSEIVAHAEKHPELGEAVRSVRAARRATRMPIGALAVAYIVTSEVDARAAVDFFARIAENRTDGIGDPVNTLLTRCAAMAYQRTRMTSALSLYMLFRAWNACRSGERFSKFQLGAPGRWAYTPTPR